MSFYYSYQIMLILSIGYISSTHTKLACMLIIARVLVVVNRLEKIITKKLRAKPKAKLAVLIFINDEK